MAADLYSDLPAGTYLRSANPAVGLIRVREMRGTWANLERVKADGTRDRRTLGWSGSLRMDLWHVATSKGPSNG